MCSLHLLELAALVAGGRDDTVGAEVALMGTGIVVTGVEAIDALLHLLGVVDGLVHPVPDAATDASVGGLDVVPVLTEVTDGIAHGMGILADEHGLVEVAGILLHPSHARVHLGVEVRVGLATEVASTACTLIVDGAAADGLCSHIAAACCIVAVGKVASVACLIAETPHDNRYVVAITVYHTLDTIHEGGNPRLHVRDALVGVVLEVGLVAAVESVVVEHGIHASRVGIVAGANSVDVVALHEQHILEHRLGGYGTAVDGVCIVAVDTLEEYLLAIDIHERVLDFDVAESVLGREGHLLIALGILLHHAYGVEVRMLGIPHERIGKFHTRHYTQLLLVGSELGCDNFLGYLLSCRVIERHLEQFLAGESVTVVKGELHVGGSMHGVVTTVILAMDVVVAHRYGGYIIKVNITEDTAHAEHILTLEVRAVAPAEHLHGEAVFLTFIYIRSDVKLGHIVGALCVAHVLAIEPYEGCRVDTAKVDEGAAAVPLGRYGEGVGIGTYGVDAVVFAVVVVVRTCLDEGRCVGVRIFHVTVDGEVISVHLPV